MPNCLRCVEFIVLGHHLADILEPQACVNVQTRNNIAITIPCSFAGWRIRHEICRHPDRRARYSCNASLLRLSSQRRIKYKSRSLNRSERYLKDIIGSRLYTHARLKKSPSWLQDTFARQLCLELDIVSPIG